MKKELDEQLTKQYPKIFRDRYAPMTQTAMCWGFDCGDGWYNIIHHLCANIQNHINNTRSNRLNVLMYNRALKRAILGNTSSLVKYYYKGEKNDMVEWATSRAIQDVEAWKKGSTKLRAPPEVCRQVVATQVKEKYGTLRFYAMGGDEYIDGMIRMAESMSSVTCETCGNAGRVRTGSWVRTLCDTHAIQEGYIEDNDEN
jgi:hypothetical protein